MSDKPMWKQKCIRILIHGEDGLFPFLSPRILMKYFPPSKGMIKNHLILGIAVKDTCIAPIYEDAKDIQLRKRTKRRKKLADSKDTALRKRGDEKATSTGFVDTEQEMIHKDDGARDLARKSLSKKPVGFTFKSINVFKCLCLLPGYRTMAVPTYDLLDDVKVYNDADLKNKTKRKKQTYGMSPAQILSSHDEISLCTPKGMQKISPELYTNCVHALQCDSFVGLFDQVHSTASKKRKHACEERTKLWLNRCLSHLERIGDGKTQQNAMAPIVCQLGQYYFKETIDSLISHESCLTGIVLIGWHCIVPRQDRLSILRHFSPSRCPSSKGILHTKDLAVLAISDLKKFLDAVRGGVNVIGTTLPALLARSKRALMLDIDNCCKYSRVDQSEDKVNVKKLDDGCIDLSCVTFRQDTSVLIPGCPCPSCSHDKHSRSYIHHLINCRELLADVLLFSHNLYQMILLCKVISSFQEKEKLDHFLDYVEDQLV